MRLNGYLIHADAFRIVVATGFKRPTKNPKTGPMIQTWILPRRINPVEAVQTGRDRVVCGDCPFRGNGCYVRIEQAPLNVWRSFHRGNYPALPSFDVFEGRAVRFGAYGDPVHIPIVAMEAIVSKASGFTGYSHQWRNPLKQGYKPYLMASVESWQGQDEAVAMGWRTFRVKRPEQPLFADEIMCVNSTSGVQCADCRLCQGATIKAKNIVINVHGKAHLNTPVLR